MDHVESKKKHWESIYTTKSLTEVSWYQPIPVTSINFINGTQLSKDAKIIDIGGGDSFLTDNLLSLEYTNLSVLDISEIALAKAKKRLGEKASEVNWIVSDITKFNSNSVYELWHDRAAFHFLTSKEAIKKYFEIAKSVINSHGFLILGTFSENGPTKCSGIEIKQYSIEALKKVVPDTFIFIEGLNIDHQTPSGSLQNFTFCKFQKK